MYATNRSVIWWQRQYRRRIALSGAQSTRQQMQPRTLSPNSQHRRSGADTSSATRLGRDRPAATQYFTRYLLPSALGYGRCLEACTARWRQSVWMSQRHHRSSRYLQHNDLRWTFCDQPPTEPLEVVHAHVDPERQWYMNGKEGE